MAGETEELIAGAMEETPAEEPPIPGAGEETPPETPEETPPEPTEEEAPEPGAEEEATPEKEAEEAEKQAEVEAKARAEAEEKTLTEFYRDNPQLKEFLKQQGNEKLRFAFFRAAEINKEFPSVAEAKQAKGDALTLSEIDGHYFGPGLEDKEALLDWLAEQDVDKETGQEQGHFRDFVHVAANRYLLSIHEEAQANPALLEDAATSVGLKTEQLAAMVQVVGAALGLKGFSLGEGSSKAGTAAGAKPAPNTRMSREQEDFRREKEDFERQRLEEFNQGWKSDVNTFVDKFISERLSQSATLMKNAGLMKVAKQAVVSEVAQQINTDKLVAARIQQMMRSGKRSPEMRQKISAYLEQRVRMVAPSVVSRLLREMGVAVVNQAKDKNATREQAAKRKEPSITGTPGRTTGENSKPRINTSNLGAVAGAIAEQMQGK